MTADKPATHLSDTPTDVSSDVVDEVRALDDAAATVDGRSALSEQTWLRLRADVRSGTLDVHVHQLVRDTHGDLLAYAQLADHSAELVVHPEHRHRGIGTSIVTTLLERDPEVRIWSHAGHPDAAKLAEDAGLVTLRELWEMDRDLGAEHPLPELPTIPEGLTIRSFAPGHDDDAWVALNAAAFADHPEQGRITVDDLHARMAEPWFDADDFFVAVDEPADGDTADHDTADDGRLVAFHWTKIEGGEIGRAHV